VVACMVCVVAVAACGKRSGEEKTSERIPSDLDSMAFKPESARVRADVDSGNSQLIQAWKSGSGDLFANAFTEQGVMLLPNGTAVLGRDSITALMGRVFSGRRMRRGSITTQDLRVVGDSALERGTYVFEIAPVKGGRAQTDSGAYETLWRYEQGQWKIARELRGPRP
jgi:uncharacterized protein (TIGR02246 family)